MSRRSPQAILASLLVIGVVLALASVPGHARYTPGVPPEVDPGTPVFAGAESPVPAESAAFDPGRSRLEAMYQADLAAGGTSFWFDRMLERPFLSNEDSYPYTRGRALYMYTHNAGPLGFAGGYAYRERPTGANQNLYTIAISDASLTEETSARKQYPSHWSSVHVATDLRVAERKFVTQNNVAVTALTVTNTGSAATSRTLTVSSPVVSTAEGAELTGTVTARYGVTGVYPRLSGDGFAVDGTTLRRDITLDPGRSVTLKVQLGAVTRELTESAGEYQRYRAYDPETAWRTQLREYNR